MAQTLVPDARGPRVDPRAPARIVSLAASNTEIVCALGLADRLVGVDDFSDFPPRIRRLPKVGRDLAIDVERVAALAPDLVLASLSVPGMERNVPPLEATGLPFIAIRPRGWDGLWDDIRAIGAACGEPARAERLIAGLTRRVETVAARVRDVATRPRVYWEWWPRPPITAGGPSWMSAMLRLAGGENCFEDLGTESGPVELAELRARRPDRIVLCWCGARKLPRASTVELRPGWSELPAVRDGRIDAVLEPCFGRPGPRLVDGLEQLARLLHPDRFA